MRQARSGRSAFLIVREDADKLSNDPADVADAISYQTLRIYETTADKIPRPPAGYEITRYLDRFFLVLPMGRTRDRQDTLDLFFSWLAPTYELAIDTSRNIQNIENLFGLLHLAPGSIVLDFGCGTGLAHEPAGARGISLIGFDTCDVMRTLAAIRGLTTVRPELLLADDFLVDAVIASYVVHLSPEAGWIRAIWKHLRPGGSFACNVHKSSGLSAFVDLMQSLGAVVTTYPDAIHGPYVVSVKPDKLTVR